MTTLATFGVNLIAAVQADLPQEGPQYVRRVLHRGTRPSSGIIEEVGIIPEDGRSGYGGLRGIGPVLCGILDVNF
jgi:hypothetical protein